MARENGNTQGRLTNAYMHGGDAALWNIARGKGTIGEKAREVIELATSPYHELTVYQAIQIISEKGEKD